MMSKTRSPALPDVPTTVEQGVDAEAYSWNAVFLPKGAPDDIVKKLNADYRKRWRDLTGTILMEAAWGMTETHTSNTFTAGFQDDDFDLNNQPIFVGLPVPGAEFKITDFETGELMPLGAEGEIRVRTPSLLKSYWNKPEATAESLVDGWLRTGDIGTIDKDGFLHFLGRRKEMLKVKGMSVFPPEIEALLGAAPAPHKTLNEYLNSIPRLKSLSDVPRGTAVLVRGDVDAKPGAKIGEGDQRLRSMVDTLRFGIDKGWKQVVFGHIGRKPEGSLAKVAARLGELVGKKVPLISDWLDESTTTIKPAAAGKISQGTPACVAKNSRSQCRR